MARAIESRLPDFGPLILQHENYSKRGYSIDMRHGLLAVRVRGRDDDRAGAQGHYIAEDGTLGDIVGSLMWKQEGKKRPMPGWAFAWPSVVTDSKKRKVRPLFVTEGYAKYSPDPRFAELAPIYAGEQEEEGPLGPAPKTPKMKIPAGTVGIVLASSNEEKEKEGLFP